MHLIQVLVIKKMHIMKLYYLVRIPTNFKEVCQKQKNKNNYNVLEKRLKHFI